MACARLLPLALVGLCAIAAFGSHSLDAAASTDASSDAYTNVPPRTLLLPGLGTSHSARPFHILSASWVSTVSVLIGPAPPAGTRLSLYRNGLVAAVSLLGETGDAEDMEGGAAGFLWTTVSLASPLPLAEGDALSLSVDAPSGSRAFLAGLVNTSYLAFALSALRQPGLLRFASNDGKGVLQMGYSFVGAIDTSAVPLGATTQAYELLTDVYSTSLLMTAQVAGVERFRSWLNLAVEGPGVRWRTVAVPASAAASTSIAPGAALSLTHSSLQADRLYSSGVLAGTNNAIVSLVVRTRRPLVAYTSDDGLGATAVGVRFVAPAIAVAAAGFLRSVDVYTDAPLPPATCIANITLRNAADTITSNVEERFDNNGSPDWRKLLLNRPLPLQAGGSLRAELTCSASFTAHVRADTGAAIVAFEIETYGAREEQT